MKKLSLFAGACALLLIASNVHAQSSQSKEIRKEVNLEENNGEKVLTITTVENGNKSVEIYKGADTDAKLQEFANDESGTTKTVIIGDDGKQHLKVETKVVIKEEEVEDL